MHGCDCGCMWIRNRSVVLVFNTQLIQNPPYMSVAFYILAFWWLHVLHTLGCTIFKDPFQAIFVFSLDHQIVAFIHEIHLGNYL